MSESAPIRIALAEDQVLLRRIMADRIELETDLSVVYEAENGQQLLQYLLQHPVDLVLTDLEMPELGGMEVIKAVKARRPDLPVVVLSSYDTEAHILAATQAGAKGYLLKDSQPEEILSAIRSVHTNGFYFREDVSQLLLKQIIHQDLLSPRFEEKELLSEREKEVVQLVCEELTNREIADRLFLSPRTIETYRKNILEKIGARNTAGIVLYAVKKGMVSLA